MPRPHRTRVRVTFDEVDMYGIVHHSKLLVYLERARIALFREGGLNPGALRDTGFGLVVVNAELTFRTPARFGDELVVETLVSKVSPVTATLDYRVLRREEVVLQASVRLAAVGVDGRPRRLPDEAMEILTRYRI